MSALVRWLAEQLFDLLAAQDPARLSLEAQGQRVRVCTGIAASERLQLPAELRPVHAVCSLMALSVRTAWAW